MDRAARRRQVRHVVEPETSDLDGVHGDFGLNFELAANRRN